MRILIATPLYPPEIGGPATYARVLEEHLPGLGIDVDVLPFSAVRHLPKGISHIAYFWHVFRRGRAADAVYALDPISVGLPAALAAKLARRKFLVRIPGDYAWEQGMQRFGVTDLLDTFVKKDEEYHLFVRALKRLEAWVARQAVQVVVPSEYLKKIVHQWGIPKRAITVIYTSTEVPETLGNKRTIRGLLKFNGKLIISVGRLVPWKGFGTLIELMPEVVKAYPNAKLFIVGSGPLERELEEKIDELGMAEHVVMAGPVEHDVLERYLGVADVFVLNTAYEGLSHLILETLGVGTPVITTRVGGNPELIEHKKNGILVPFDDKKQLLKALTDMLGDKDLQLRLAREGRKSAKAFSPEKTAEATAKLLRQKV